MRAISRAALVGVTAALGIGGTLAMSAPPGAAQAPGPAAVRILADQSPPLPQGAVRLGPLPPSTSLRLDVTLNVPDPAALSAFLAALADRGSPQFGHFLRPGQFGPLFGPALSSVATVRAALQQAGLSPGAVTSNRLAIPVTATAAAVEHAFGIELILYRLPGGRTGYTNATAPEIPAAVAGYVSGVLGLDTLYQEHSALARPSSRPAGPRAPAPRRLAAVPDTSGPQACTAAADTGAYTANELASYYVMSPLYKLGDLGAGTRIGLFELEPNHTSDISAYKKCYRVSTSVSYVKVDGGAGSGAGSGEAALDIEDALGLAPHSAIDVYQGPNNATGVYDTYNAIISADTDQVISTSWGSCELNTTSAQISDEQTLFEQADSQGQTVFAAAGDTGSTDCLRAGGSNASKLSVDNPASQPYVDGVGGTSIGSTENVWNDSATDDGAGGGGVSVRWCMPGYQYQTAVPGLISGDSVTNSGCPTAEGQYVRQVPDVSADADPQTGYAVYYAGGWTVIGGTSAAAPLWAAVAALIDASPFCADYGSGHPGVLSQGLYDVASTQHSYIYSGGEVLYDVTNGNNDYTPSGYTGGLYPSTTGYDMASGLGTPLVTGLAASGKPEMFLPGLATMMCRVYATQSTSTAVTGVSPPSGTTAGGTTVTVTGSGFLPIAGADKAEVGTTVVAASCSSSTTCTLVTPKHNAGTVNIRISAEDFGYSPVTTADEYTYETG